MHICLHHIDNNNNNNNNYSNNRWQWKDVSETSPETSSAYPGYNTTILLLLSELTVLPHFNSRSGANWKDTYLPYLRYLRLHSELRDHRYGVRRPPVSLSFCTLRSFSSYSSSSAIATELLPGNSKLGSDARCQQRCHIHVFIATATVLPASSGTPTFFTSTTPSRTALSSVLSRARTILQPFLPLATHGT